LKKNRDGQLQLEVGVNCGFDTFFTRVRVGLELVDFFNSNSTPIDIVTCPIKNSLAVLKFFINYIIENLKFFNYYETVEYLLFSYEIVFSPLILS
jgi:hypothetical protein